MPDAAPKAALRVVPPHPHIGKSRIARYLQLATLFRNRISGGEWAVGERIPNVDDLAAEFGVARGTIREALDQLADEGLIERFRAKGSFVRRSPGAGIEHHLESDWNSLIRTHEGAKIKVLEHRRVATLPAYAGDYGTLAADYEMMRRLHLRGKLPYLLARFYLTRELYLLGSAQRFRREPTLPILHEIASDRIARARQTITIGSADLEVAALLEVPLNSPVAHVRRVAVDHAGVLVYLGEGIYRGDMVKLEIDLR
jgi:GntR family transcriptional regulator